MIFLPYFFIPCSLFGVPCSSIPSADGPAFGGEALQISVRMSMHSKDFGPANSFAAWVLLFGD
jgi:hypothetical protein